jgi:hypothetical protein
MRKPFVFAVFLILLASYPVLLAQQSVPGATPVQQVQPLYTCNQVQTATGAGNTAVTVTFTPPSGQFVYLCSFYASQTANAAVTVGAGPAPIFTTTGLQNNLVWWGDNAVKTTGQTSIDVDTVFVPWTIKSNAPGTAVTIVTSAGQSTQSIRLNATAFFAQ